MYNVYFNFATRQYTIVDALGRPPVGYVYVFGPVNFITCRNYVNRGGS